MHQNHHNYINRMHSNDDDYSARLKKHRLCISLFQAFQKGLNPQVSKATTPSPEEEKSSGCPFQTDLPTYPGIGFSSPFHHTKVQLFLGGPNGRLQLLTLRIQLQQFIIHFLCGFSVVFCNLGCSRVCCFQPMAFAKPTWRKNKSLLAECLLHIVECPMRKP